MGTKFTTTDEYLATLPETSIAKAQEIREIIRKAAPKATEVISYNIPAFKQNKVLVWFAGYKSHIGFYPGGGAIDIFQDDLTAYKTSKGAIQFPVDKPLPAALIKKIVKYRVKELAE
ncbi:Uncharacterized conserved protein YdhG, YjbR/CyaY-like superfamily, DUF1801 family [Chitinophaga eiseniae]|uniref:Uncharacterized conserved protein YdhG, YjbR/CyaY-like superfamily, DUF1801 family n=1 Tax=Chitinophaga eiseniae TaxID=634771 RepID=A0A1T4U2Z7_9BACT|nr:DUF1801 domain-containing protein [Chitinophaga eiseniae]SKA46901.1 Uncharacterized conserved protein YdhG, YjbR/CyaY-like superfamily, DUF1801 family [Chitinophaga eiseniae]